MTATVRWCADRSRLSMFRWSPMSWEFNRIESWERRAKCIYFLACYLKTERSLSHYYSSFSYRDTVLSRCSVPPFNVSQEELGKNSEFKNWLISVHKLKWLNCNLTQWHNILKKNIYKEYFLDILLNNDLKTYQYCY